jgi:catechol 2,3-dioxygenase-like lactoylglutathione lyase family enzyme
MSANGKPPRAHSGPMATSAAMPSVVHHVTFDCHNAYQLASFWAEVLGGRLAADDHPGDPEALVQGVEPNLLFVTVPDDKVVKNRVHLDLMPDDRTRDEEVERLIKVGATLVDDCRRPDGTGWVVLADPEGNELCIERSKSERA